jgi:hypothetical protein
MASGPPLKRLKQSQLSFTPSTTTLKSDKLEDAATAQNCSVTNVPADGPSSGTQDTTNKTDLESEEFAADWLPSCWNLTQYNYFKTEYPWLRVDKKTRMFVLC